MVFQDDVEEIRLGNKIDDLLKKLREKIDGALEKAQKELDAAKAKINQLADKVQAAAKSAMSGAINKIQAELNALKVKAKKAGVNIDSCLGTDETNLLGLLNKFAGEMVHCVSDRVTDAINYAQDGLNAVGASCFLPMIYECLFNLQFPVIMPTSIPVFPIVAQQIVN